MDFNDEKRPLATTLRVRKDEKEWIERISEATRLKQVEVVTLIVKAGLEALKDQWNNQITLPLRFELVDVGKNLSNGKRAQKRSRKNGLSEVPVEGFEPPTPKEKRLATSFVFPYKQAL